MIVAALPKHPHWTVPLNDTLPAILATGTFFFLWTSCRAWSLASRTMEVRIGACTLEYSQLWFQSSSTDLRCHAEILKLTLSSWKGVLSTEQSFNYMNTLPASTHVLLTLLSRPTCKLCSELWSIIHNFSDGWLVAGNLKPVFYTKRKWERRFEVKVLLRVYKENWKYEKFSRKSKSVKLVFGSIAC